MRYPHYKVLMALLLVTLSSCSEHKDQVIDKFQDAFDQNSKSFKQPLTDKEMVLIIPRTGCSSCIGIADYFYKSDQYDPEKILFIFTKVSSLKAIRIRDGIDLDQANTYTDSDNDFSNGILDSLYPVILNMNNGRVLELNYLTSQNTQLLNNSNTD